MTPHPHADVLRAIADGETEFLHMYCQERADGSWCTCNLCTCSQQLALRYLAAGDQVRIKPKPPETININGIEVPAPLRDIPPGTHVYVVDIRHPAAMTVWRLFQSNIADMQRLSDGLLHATREAAEIHAKALLSFTRMEIKHD